MFRGSSSKTSGQGRCRRRRLDRNAQVCEGQQRRWRWGRRCSATSRCSWWGRRRRPTSIRPLEPPAEWPMTHIKHSQLQILHPAPLAQTLAHPCGWTSALPARRGSLRGGPQAPPALATPPTIFWSGKMGRWRSGWQWGSARGRGGDWLTREPTRGAAADEKLAAERSSTVRVLAFALLDPASAAEPDCSFDPLPPSASSTFTWMNINSLRDFQPAHGVKLALLGLARPCRTPGHGTRKEQWRTEDSTDRMS